MNLLDTNACVDILRRRSPRLVRKITDVGVEQIAVSSISAGELFVGALKSSDVERNLAAVELLLSSLVVLSFDPEAAQIYGVVRSRLERAGNKIGHLDTLIAAHAVAVGAVLVTNNTREFQRVEGLKIEDWTE
ncbi:MAG TPA: PIN domain-containing protein [Gemmatimonadaceae bacterium]|jgi:tRNA(fMet)-specific endonuclease VapC|nr:PIN domain-containing protein [Gemmatimonadaceae bacterium]